MKVVSCVSERYAGFVDDDIHIRYRRLLEMQVLFCELVGKFSFSLPENESTRTCLTTTLRPTLSKGQKGAQLCIERIA
jgi:hypothetical protein